MEYRNQAMSKMGTPLGHQTYSNLGASQVVEAESEDDSSSSKEDYCEVPADCSCFRSIENRY